MCEVTNKHYADFNREITEYQEEQDYQKADLMIPQHIYGNNRKGAIFERQIANYLLEIKQELETPYVKIHIGNNQFTPKQYKDSWRKKPHKPDNMIQLTIYGKTALIWIEDKNHFAKTWITNGWLKKQVTDRYTSIDNTMRILCTKNIHLTPSNTTHLTRYGINTITTNYYNTIKQLITITIKQITKQHNKYTHIGCLQQTVFNTLSVPYRNSTNTFKRTNTNKGDNIHDRDKG